MRYRLAPASSIRKTAWRGLGSGWLALSLAVSAWAQTPATAPGEAARPIGVVTAIDHAARQITIKTDAGPEMAVRWQEGTKFLRVPPGEKDLKNAAPITVTDIKVGDRILARGRVSEDRQSIPATSIIVMTQADIAKKHEADRAEWQRRGVAGVITAVNESAKEITITVHTPEGKKPMTIALAEGAALRRYAPDSIKFSDAKPSAFAELKVGDQVRARGDKSADGSRLTAEELVSGSFRNIAGTVVSLNAQENTLKITDLATKQPLVVHTRPDSTLRKLPPYVAQMLARRNAGGGAAEGGPGRPGSGGEGARMRPGGPPRGAAEAGDRPRAPNADGGPRPGGGPWAGGVPDLQQMLDRMPPIKVADLKPGDAVIVASTTGADPSQITAITLLAGVEPLLTAPAQGGQAMTLGTWSLEMNMSLP